MGPVPVNAELLCGVSGRPAGLRLGAINSNTGSANVSRAPVCHSPCWSQRIRPLMSWSSGFDGLLQKGGYGKVKNQ